jgi:hypothetical protein
VRRVEIDDATDGIPEAVDGSLSGFSQMRLQLGEGHLDRIGIGAVGREEVCPILPRLLPRRFFRRARHGRYCEFGAAILE